MSLTCTFGAVYLRAPGRIRTCDTRFRRAVLYPLSYEGARSDYRAAHCACADPAPPRPGPL